MAVNVPIIDKNRFSFGPGVLYIAHIADGDPGSVSETALDASDVGAVRSGASLAIARTKLDVQQGSPRVLVNTFAQEESATMTVNGIQWRLDNLALALGAGVTTGSGADPEILEFGGDMNFSDVAVKFVHVLPSGYTLTCRIWKAQGNGDVSVTFGDDLHEIPYVFNAIEALTNWDNVAIASNSYKRLFRLELDKP